MKRKAFTLIELIVVVTIIGILSAVIIVSYNGAQKRSRDSKRKADLTAIASALEIKYSDDKRYAIGNGYSCSSADGTSWTTMDASMNTYLADWPIDPTQTTSCTALPWNQPIANNFYAYTVRTSASGYCLTANLEANTGNGLTYPSGSPCGPARPFNYLRPAEYIYIIAK